MSPETRDPKRLRRRVLDWLDSLLATKPDPVCRADLQAMVAYWTAADYKALNDLVNCYEP